MSCKYNGIPIRAVTEKACGELDHLRLSLMDVEMLLKESYDCTGSRRRGAVEEKCVTKDGKTLKVVIELKISKTRLEKYWRIRHASFV